MRYERDVRGSPGKNLLQVDGNFFLSSWLRRISPDDQGFISNGGGLQVLGKRKGLEDGHFFLVTLEWESTGSVHRPHNVNNPRSGLLRLGGQSRQQPGALEPHRHRRGAGPDL